MFENAYSPMPQTLPAHASLFTGLEPRLHGSLTNMIEVPESLTTLAEVLRDTGYRTGAFIGALVLSFQTGIAQGFEKFDQFGRSKRGQVKKSNRRSAREVTDAALRWARSLDTEGPFMLWAHYYDPHVPLDAPADALRQVPVGRVRSWVEARRQGLAGSGLELDEIVDYWHGYAAEIRSMDAEIGRLLAGLDRRGLLEDTVVVVTADHGEGLYEHRERGHSFTVYNELVRVPLLIADPARDQAGRRIETHVSLVDLFPTALQLCLDRDWEGMLSGRDLTPLLSGSGGLPERPVFFERPHHGRWKFEAKLREEPEIPREWGVMAGVVDRGAKLIRGPGGTLELFLLDTDPSELANLAAQDGERAAELAALLEEWIERHPVPAPGSATEVSQEQIERLRELGYVGDGG